MDKEETVLHKGHGTGGTRWWYIFLAWLLKTERWGGQIWSEDDTAEVECQCGKKLWAHSEMVTWCPKCHHGYVTEFRTFRVPNWMYRLRSKARIKPEQKVVSMLHKHYREQHFTSGVEQMQELQDEIDGK